MRSMIMIYLHTKFHMPRSNSSSITAVKLNAKNNFWMATMLFYVLQKYLTEVGMLFESSLRDKSNRTPLHGTSVDHT
jgi:hypothetical protein